MGGFFIVIGWNWYHLPHKPHFKFILFSILMWIFLIVGFWLFKLVYKKIIKKFGRISFWHKEFNQSINEFYLIFSLFFLVFFSTNEILSLVYFLFVMIVLFWRFQVHLSKHPTAFLWQTVNRAVFSFTIFLFLICSVLQYISFDFYILDTLYNYFNIVLFRSWAMTCFWLAGFTVTGFLYFKLNSKLRYFFISFWVALFILFLFAWGWNIGILYWTGFYLNPTFFTHAGEGAGRVVWNYLTYILFVCFVLLSALFIFVMKYMSRAYKLTPKRHWYYYNFSIFTIAIFSIFGLSSFWSTPEVVITKSFYSYFLGEAKEIELSPIIFKKLERFGLFYQPQEYKVNSREQVFTESKEFLPEKFKENPPNIFIIFFESFSARLTSVYNDEFIGVTPGLQQMSENENTTVFKNYYNASIPTITGLMSQLCSFLPPTGHEEIEKENQFREHKLLCLPEVLEKEGGYQYTNYTTAVPKTFAHKDTIFASMGVNDIWGRDELAKLTDEEQLSWGYSDHQLYSLVWDNFIEKKEDPWFIMLSTVDNHPPYDLAKDMIYWEDGKNKVLNSVHTSDDAFRIFWQKFEQSEFYDNTIVIAVADHAIFPQAMDNKYFDEKHHALLPYDENMFMMYVPDNVLPKEVELRSSGLDFMPTLLHVLDINIPNSFEGYSIFDEREKYPNLLGMHEIGLYINEFNSTTQQYKEKYGVPTDISCKDSDYTQSVEDPLTLCEYLDFFTWRRQMLQEGRFWK